MSQRAIGWTLLGLLALFTAAAMLGQALLFHWGDRDFTGAVEAALQRVDAGDWTGAERAADRAMRLWDRGSFLVALKYAESDFTLLEVYLVRMLAAIDRRDPSAARQDGLSCLYLFDNITSIAPRP